jgi:cellulose synthase/poly-beta-1,6-N-acetylglucosamine synthase-like glycosyltransferase
MQIDLTLFSYAMAAVVLYYAFLFVRGLRLRPPSRIADADRPLVVVVIPARNEELVIKNSLSAVLSSRYRGDLRVLVVDDGSSDDTADIADDLASGDARLRVLRRSRRIAGTGKSDVLNHAYATLSWWHDRDELWFAGKARTDIVLCIVDADGRLSPTALDDASAFFASPHVGAVQIGVQIRNAPDSLLARMQDIEFVGFSFMVQAARDGIGSVGLGGNGQFTRMSALDTLGPTPWSSKALTEDLDLGLRLMTCDAAGLRSRAYRLRYCSTAWVEQEGLTHLRPFLRQRTRWTQGHYQCWRHIPKLIGARRVRVANRLDTLAYLSFILVVMITSAALVLRLLSAVGLITTTSDFLPWLGEGFAFRATTFVLSWPPIWVTLATYQRFAIHRLRTWELPAISIFFAGYVYVWALTTVRAWIRLALGRNNWVKTPRVEVPSNAFTTSR